MKKLATLFLLISSINFYAQNVIISGFVKNESNTPIKGVTISSKGHGTISDLHGFYKLTIPFEEKVLLKYNHIAYISLEQHLNLKKSETNIKLDIILKEKVENISEITIENNKNEAEGVISISKKDAINLPSANAGIENVLMTLGGVNNSNELSTQYNVRGGNFDENLVYVNGIEIYRPQLIRSGQQEGLSFVNTDMVQQVKFSTGGFQAKYGDKMSSVLDIQYREPEKFGLNVNASMLGGSATLEGTLFDGKLKGITSLRYRNNSLFIKGKDIETNSNPNFTDVQSFLSFPLNEKLNLEFLGNITVNHYNFTPKTRQTKFGSLNNPLALLVYYDGQEKDQFKTFFGALKGSYVVNDNLNINLTTSSYQTIEEEYYDILAQYNLGEVDSDLGSENFGEIVYSNGIGSQLTHARNDLDALIKAVDLKSTYSKNNHRVNIGLKLQEDNIRDRINEWEQVDSLGFSVRPPDFNSNNQPYASFDFPIIPYQSVKSKNETTIKRVQWFAQYSNKNEWNGTQIWYNFGLRSHHWKLEHTEVPTNTETTYSYRGQFAIKPDWNEDMLFRIAMGTYNQPPFYKEFRAQNGTLNSQIKSQKSFQVVMGHEYSFKLWDRPFNLTSELYYKHLTDLNAYTLDNVKIRYVARNDTKGYATGLDIRLHGEFVPGTQSWVSIGLLKTEENRNNHGFIARPTDQRFKFGMLFQDYVPNIPNIKMYLNLVFNSALPGGAPSYSNAYNYQHRLNSYKRADLGIAYVFKDEKNISNVSWLGKVREFSIGFELYNMFDVQNSITNTWVRDVYSKQFYAVPNYMTPRLFNIKTSIRF